MFGHTQCGGIRFLLENAPMMLEKKQHSFIAKWMEIARPAFAKVTAGRPAEKSLQDQATMCAEYSFVNSLNNLATFPWIQERVASGKLSLHAWYFDLATGMVHRYDDQSDQWLTE